jgi:hypothetical protein
MYPPLRRALVILSIPLACLVTSSYAGYFDKATCENSRSFAKRVFLSKQQGMTYAKYREIESDPPPGPAGDLVRNIERAIFTNPKITSESLASEYAYSVCITWK